MLFEPDNWRAHFSYSSIRYSLPRPNCSEKQLEVNELSRGERFYDVEYTEDGEPFALPWSWSRVVVELTSGDCRKVAILVGNLCIEEHEHYDEHDDVPHTYEHEDLYPDYMTPPPKLFEVAKGTPKQVENAVINSFQFYWLDRDACVSRLRTAVEIFLDSEGIVGNAKSGAPIPLGQRLKEYEKTNAKVAEMLEAVKWLGDTGAHELRKVNHESVNDGLRQISRALAQRYVFDKDDAAAKEIIANKGPRRGK